MNLKTAAYASAFGFVLSFLVALLAGVPLLDVVIRALIWGLVLGALAAGAETLLRSQLPDLFAPVEASEAVPRDDERAGESVNIVLEDDVERPFVEEIVETGEDSGSFVATGLSAISVPSVSMAESDQQPPQPTPAHAAPSAESASGGEDEQMPEIGSFLNSFRPPSEGDDGVPNEPAAAGAPDIGEYAPGDGGGGSPSSSSSPYAPSKGADLEGMEQDPAILAKAVKSVMSKT